MKLAGKKFKMTGRTYRRLAAAIGFALAVGTFGAAEAATKDVFDNFKGTERYDILTISARNAKTTEFNNSTGLAAINADKAYAFGYSGAGVTLGIVDNAVREGHVEFRGKVHNVNTSYFKGDDEWDWSKYDHGSHVAGIMVARLDGTAKNADGTVRGMHGVAYNSALESVATHDSELTINWADIKSLSDNTQIINNSYGWNNASHYVQEVESAIINKDKVFVYSSGNDGNPSADNVKINFLDNSSIKNNILIVGSIYSHSLVEGDPNISYFSNLANGAESVMVFAPGARLNDNINENGIYSVNGNSTSEYTAKSGTSMAAPYVTGTIGLVKEAFPYLYGKQLIDTILTTTNKDFNLRDYYFQSSGKSTLDHFRLIVTDANNLNDNRIIQMELNEIYESKINYFRSRRFNSISEFTQDNLRHQLGDKFEIVYMTREQIFGHGILDAGRAVQGPGYFDAARLDDSHKRNYGDSQVYLYAVNTGEKEKNFEKRSYSIWSNNIGEENNDLPVGLAKSGSEVDLILLGKNTYTGPTIAHEGNVRILRQTQGDVAALQSGASVTVNGAAKNVLAFGGGSVNITDTIDKNGMDGVLKNSLPDKTVVDIEGGLIASSTGDKSVINATLSDGNSIIEGALHQGDLAEINLALANEAKLLVNQNNFSYMEHTYEANNAINELTLNNKGQIDLSQDGAFKTLNIKALKGNGGVFIAETDLLNNTGDRINVENADGTQKHYLGVMDKNGFLSPDGEHSVWVATAPTSVTFEGGAMTDSGVYAYMPQIASQAGAAGKYDWYFYGFHPATSTDTLLDRVLSYTTDTILGNGISANNASYKVRQGNASAMQINKEGNENVLTGVAGSVSFTGDGPVDINVTHEYSKGASNAKIIGIGYYDGTNDYGNIYSFSAEQPVNVNLKGTSGTAYGIYTAETHEASGNAMTNTMNFANDLNVLCLTAGDPTARKYGIKNEGDMNVGGNVGIDIYAVSGDSFYAIENNGNIAVEGDLNIALNGNPYGFGSQVLNTGKLGINGKTNITLKGFNNDSYETSCYPAILNNTMGSMNFGDDVTISVDGSGAQYGEFTGISLGDESLSHFHGDLNLQLQNFSVRDFIYPIQIKKTGELIVDGTLSVTVPTSKNNTLSGSTLGFNTLRGGTLGFMTNDGRLSANQFYTNGTIYNSGTMTIHENADIYDLRNNGDLTLLGETEINQFNNKGKLSANTLNVDTWEDNSFGNGSITALRKRRISQFEATPRDFFVRQGRGREGVASLRRTASDAAWRKKTRRGPKGLVRRFLKDNKPSQFNRKHLWAICDSKC